MKTLILLSILSLASISFAGDIKIVKKDLNLKVAEITTTVSCMETDDWDPGTDAEFVCNLGTIKTQLQKKLGEIVKLEGLDRISNYVLSNSVDDTKIYDVKFRVYYY